MKKLIAGALLMLVVIPFGCTRETPPPASPAPAVEVLEITPAIAARTSYSHLVPKSTPVVSTNMHHPMRGDFNFLSIYAGGEVVYIEETGLRMASPEYPATRTWKTGKLRREELESVLDLFQSRVFRKLNSYYKFPGKPTQGGGFSMGDMAYTVSVNNTDLHQMVYAIGYLTPDQGLTYPDMPSPLDKVYKQLRDIAVNRTQEIARETINASIAWDQ